jgi:1L-myo-inositol 1-phosphate cytidylyltransferase
MQAVIIAGGLSSRINKDREIIPKPLYTVEGKCLIEHVILNLKEAGILDFIVIVGFMADRIALRLGDGMDYGVNIKYVMTPYFHKTLGLSLLLAQEHVKGEFILAMSDHLIEQEAVNKIVNYPLDDDSCALLVDKKIKDIFWLEDAAKVKLEGNLIKGVSKDYDTFTAVDCGIFKCNPLIFTEIRKVKDRPDSMSHAVSVFSDNGKMFAVDIGEHKWIDVDEYDELEVARVMFRKNPRNNLINTKDSHQ